MSSVVSGQGWNRTDVMKGEEKKNLWTPMIDWVKFNVVLTT